MAHLSRQEGYKGRKGQTQLLHKSKQSLAFIFPTVPRVMSLQEGNYCTVTTLSSNNHADPWGLHWLPSHNMENSLNRLLP